MSTAGMTCPDSSSQRPTTGAPVTTQPATTAEPTTVSTTRPASTTTEPASTTAASTTAPAPATTAATTTVAATTTTTRATGRGGACVRNPSCDGNPWCDNMDYVTWCPNNAGSCPSPMCMRRGATTTVTTGGTETTVSATMPATTVTTPPSACTATAEAEAGGFGASDADPKFSASRLALQLASASPAVCGPAATEVYAFAEQISARFCAELGMGDLGIHRKFALLQRAANRAAAALNNPTDYDCIILVRSLADFAKEKRIWLLRSLCSDFAPQQCQDVRIISVVGLFNKGKTFLLNKLFGLRLPSGKTQVTQGLSCVYLKERRMLLIDSPGVQSTVNHKSDSIDRVVDAQTTEAFLFELVSQLSDHIIFVVNDFTSFEQKNIQIFERKEESRARDKPVRELVVVHNLATTQDPGEAEHLFNQQITSKYDGVESHLGNLFYTARRNPPVHHFAICKDGTRAGAKFNPNNIRLLLDHLEHAKKLPERVVLKGLIRDKLDGLLPRFLMMGSGDAGGRKVEYCEASGGQEDGAFHVSCEMDVIKKEGVISDLGEVISHDKSFSPEPMIFDQTSDEYRIRTILFECPGVLPKDVTWDQTGEGLTIRIEKRKLIDEGKVTAISGMRQQSGIFERNFRFADGPFEIAEDECNLEHGVLRLTLKKCLINKRGGLQSIQESRVLGYSHETTSLPSEAEGLRHAPVPSDADAHPSTQVSLAGKTSEGFQLVKPTAGHCLTPESFVLTPAGAQSAGSHHQDTDVKSVMLETAGEDDADDAQWEELKWSDGEFCVTADHSPYEHQLLVVPAPAPATLASSYLRLAEVIQCKVYQAVQDVIEIEMAFPASTLLASSMSPQGPFVTVFGKQPCNSCFDTIMVMELSRLPAALPEVFQESECLQACRSLAGEAELESGTFLFLVPHHLQIVRNLLDVGRLRSLLKGRHIILSAEYKEEIQRLVRSLPRKHKVQVTWCKSIVEVCQFFQPERDMPGERLVQRRTFVNMEPEPSVVPTTVSTTELSTVRALKRRLQSLCGLPRFRQRLLHGGRDLDDSVGLESPLDLQLVLLSLIDASDFQQGELEDAISFGSLDPGVDFRVLFIGSAAQVEAILQRPQDPGSCEGRNMPLCKAAAGGHLEIARLLVEAKAEPDAQEKRIAGDPTPLMLACFSGRIEVLRFLLEAGASPDRCCEENVSSLFVAANVGHLEVVRLLLGSRADTDPKDLLGRTPLWTACAKGHAQIVAMLLKAGADKEVRDCYGRTPLWAACNNQRLEVVGRLLRASAKPSIRDKHGKSILSAAAGNPAILRLLATYRWSRTPCTLGDASLEEAEEIFTDVQLRKADPNKAYNSSHFNASPFEVGFVASMLASMTGASLELSGIRFLLFSFKMQSLGRKRGMFEEPDMLAKRKWISEPAMLNMARVFLALCSPSLLGAVRDLQADGKNYRMKFEIPSHAEPFQEAKCFVGRWDGQVSDRTRKLRVLSRCNLLQRDPAQERASLQEVLSKLGHASEVPEEYCVGWDVIVCGRGCVRGIRLSGQGLDGQVPQQLEKLRGLKKLYLNYNPQLAGSLHDFQHLRHLQILNLGHSAITGKLEDLQNMTDLEHLELDHTAITGKLEDLQNMTGLQSLNLGHTAITGKLEDLQNMTGLLWLYLDHTAITGKLEDLQNMTGLGYLELDHTAINGKLEDLQNMTGLRRLNLGHTAITGKLEGLQNMTGLRWLYLDHTAITGKLEDLQALTPLMDLHLTGTDVSGDLRALHSRKLEQVHLARTKVTGRIESKLLYNLKILDLTGSKAAFVPNAEADLKALTILSVSGCPLDRPAEDFLMLLGDMYSLARVDAAGCNLTGNLRSHFSGALQLLDLSRNRIEEVMDVPAGSLLSLAENELPLSFKRGVLTQAFDRGIRLDLTNVDLADKEEARELLRQGKVRPTPKRVADDEDHGFSCYGLEDGPLDVTPSLFLPELCGCLPGWQGNQIACAKCSAGSFNPDFNRSECTACPANSSHTDYGAVTMQSCRCDVGRIFDDDHGKPRCMCEAHTALFRGSCVDCLELHLDSP
ncbi:warA [Symbiodinium sp. CCMP2592]|nr:warA [Symbiodinium sp. CCMP2592]